MSPSTPSTSTSTSTSKSEDKGRKTEDRPLRTKSEAENTGTLPVGHPEAGYVSPDLSKHDQTGTLPPEEKEWHEARNDARDEEVEKVEENEAEVEKREREEREERADKEREAQEKREEARLNPKRGSL